MRVIAEVVDAEPVCPASRTWRWPRITAMIDPILPELRAALADLAPETADDSVDLHRRPITAGSAPCLDAEYWVANVRQPVRFSQAIAAAAQNHGTFIEDQPAPAADPRHHRNPGVGHPSPQHRNSVARHRRHR